MPPERLRIGIGGEWSLVDWYVFPRTLSQVYAFLYSLVLIEELQEEPDEDDHLYITYTTHPWRGGYSAVNFYGYLNNLIPKQLRPQVASIHYESPGWIELSCVALTVALSLKRIVKALCDSGREVASLYNDIYKGLHDRRLLNISVKREELHLEREHLEFIEHSMDSLSRIMGFTGVAELNRIAPSPLAAIKILLSFYRRVRTLGEYQRKGKAEFDADEPTKRP